MEIAIMGYGVVGSGVAEVIAMNSKSIAEKHWVYTLKFAMQQSN